jgi:hypothetical protein
MASVITGLLNKQDAFDLSISEITVETHRGRMKRKMQAECLVDLAEMAMKLRLGQMSRLVDATLSPVGRDDYSSKSSAGRAPAGQTINCAWRGGRSSSGSPVGEPPMGDLGGCPA